MLDRLICEKARLSRDARFDGRFFTGVLSTGIYCRPVCPAPPPKSENVVYFAQAFEAERAGLRPCLRCHPESAPGSALWMGQEHHLQQAISSIQEGYLADHSVEQLAHQLNFSERHLRRLLVKNIGISPQQLENSRRLLFAKKLLNETSLQMQEIAFASGFDSVRQFNHAFKKRYQRTPGQLRTKPEKEASESGKVTLFLNYRPPYNWEQILEFMKYRQIDGVESIRENSYRRSISYQDEGGHLRQGFLVVSHEQSRQRLRCEIHIHCCQDLFRIKKRLEKMFDLEAVPEAIETVLLNQKFIEQVKPEYRDKIKNMVKQGIRLPGCWDPFELAIRAIIGQQISVKAASTICSRVVARTGTPIENQLGSEVGTDVSFCFPEAQILQTANLDNLGLTTSRIKTIRELSGAVVNGHLNLLSTVPLTTEQLSAQLLDIFGIGQWTASYICMRALQDPNSYPIADLVLEKNITRLLADQEKTDIESAFKLFQPWRAYAALMIWQLSPLLQPK